MNRVPFKGAHKGSIIRFYNIGALLIRMGFWGHSTIITIRSPQNSICNYLGPYSGRFRVVAFRFAARFTCRFACLESSLEFQIGRA